MFDLVNSFLGSLDARVFGAQTTPIVPVRKNVRFKKDSTAVYHCPSIHHLSESVRRQADFPTTGDGYVVLVRHFDEFLGYERKEKPGKAPEYILRTACITAVWQKAQGKQWKHACDHRSSSKLAMEFRNPLLFPDIDFLDVLRPLFPSDNLFDAEEVIALWRPKVEKAWIRYGTQLLQGSGGDRDQARWQLARGMESELVPALALLLPTEGAITTFVTECAKILFSKATPPSP